MNPGLIPPAEVAAAAKRGLELRAKISPGRHFGRRPSSQGAGRTSAAVAARRGGYERLFRPSRGRQGVEKPRMGRRNRPLCGLYRVALVGRRARPSLGGQFNGAPEQDRGGIIAAACISHDAFSDESRLVISAQAGIQALWRPHWVPAFAGMTRVMAAKTDRGAKRSYAERFASFALESVPVVIRLERPSLGDAEVFRLFGRHLG